MLTLISSFFRTIIIINIYRHLSSQKTSCYKIRFISPLFTLILFLISAFVHQNFQYLLPIVSIPLFTLYAYITYKSKLDYTFVITALSHTLYYVVFNAVSLLLSIILLPSYYLNINISFILIFIANGSLTYLVTHSLFKIKRLKSGLTILTEKRFINLGVLIIVFILALKTADSLYIGSSKDILLLPLATILLAFLLFTWWRRQITKSYIEKLRKLEVQSLYDELAEKERLIKKLTADNQSLSRIIHKDNKLIPAMENAVTNFLSGAESYDINRLRQYGQELTAKLQDMAQDRQGVLDCYENESYKLRLTGHVGIDAILVYMKKKAENNNITFDCKHSPEHLEFLLSKISEEDLAHLLSDLIENALISMRDQESGKLQVTFGKIQKEAYIAVADNGVPFDITTLHSFGLHPHTTHEDKGGSGIGLMDIWQIKKKHRATIQIQEYRRTNENYTKKILFSFNSKNHYVIQSFRHAEISNTQTRGDLYVIPSDTKDNNEGKNDERDIHNLNSRR